MNHQKIILKNSKRKNTNQHESFLQQECVKWFRLQYNDIKELLFAIPNGGLRNKITAKKLKNEGVQKGVPDLFLSVPSSEHNGLFIEMKFGNNKPTIAQKIMMNKLTEQNYKCEVCYSFDGFKQIIKTYLKK